MDDEEIDWELDQTRVYFEEMGFLGSLMEALHFCRDYDRSPPDWLVAGVDKALFRLSHQREGRGQRSDYERHYQLGVDLVRFEVVSDLRDQGIPFREVFQAASDKMEASDDPDHQLARASEEAIKRSWRRCVKSRRNLWEKLGVT